MSVMGDCCFGDVSFSNEKIWREWATLPDASVLREIV